MGCCKPMGAFELGALTAAVFALATAVVALLTYVVWEVIERWRERRRRRRRERPPWMP
jgi:peptidoglycan/LPS O-acetylase OafA/YrhL